MNEEEVYVCVCVCMRVRKDHRVKSVKINSWGDKEGDALTSYTISSTLKAYKELVEAPWSCYT